MTEAASQDRQADSTRGLRRAFAILGRELAWLDNAATTSGRKLVLRAMDEFIASTRIPGAAHQLGTEATLAYEGVSFQGRGGFLGASAPEEVCSRA